MKTCGEYQYPTSMKEVESTLRNEGIIGIYLCLRSNHEYWWLINRNTRRAEVWGVALPGDQTKCVRRLDELTLEQWTDDAREIVRIVRSHDRLRGIAL